MQESVARFFQNVEARAWTDAEKELDEIRQKSESTSWSKGYLKALEGLLLTYRSSDDRYIYLPRALANRSEESLNTVRREFGDFASGELHGEYDRGYFKALEDYLSLLSTIKTPGPSPAEETSKKPEKEKDPSGEKDSE